METIKNRFGLSEIQLLRIYPDESTQKAKNFMNKHFCWDRQGYCKLCGKLIPRESYEAKR